LKNGISFLKVKEMFLPIQKLHCKGLSAKAAGVSIVSNSGAGWITTNGVKTQ
jgi:hypothetical protein